MDSDEVVEMVKRKLGYPSISLEISDDDIESYVSLGVTKLQDHITWPKYITKSYATGVPIDLSKDKVFEVTNVFRTADVSNIGPDGEMNIFGVRNLADDMTLYLAAIKQRSDIESVIDVAFRYINGKLYLDDFYEGVTIEYLPRLDAAEDVQEPWAIEWLVDYVTANAKVTIGMVRRKFTVNDSPVTLDGDGMIAEGEAKLSELNDTLTSKGYTTTIR